jgi:hypothetical protein
MPRKVAGLPVLLLAAWSNAFGQDSGPHFLEIRLPPEVKSHTVFIRYILDGDDLGGWVEQLPDVVSYLIAITRAGRPATRIKALVYAPGCAIQTLDLPISGLNNEHYAFICQVLPNIPISGIVSRPNRLDGHDVTLHAIYLARWAQPFMKPADAIITTIPMGDEAATSPEGHFLLSVPDLSRDPLAGAPDHAGEFQIWARDKTSGDVVAELVPSGLPALKTQMGGLKIQTHYPADILFTPCAVNRSPVHNAEGFAVRPNPADPCDR